MPALASRTDGLVPLKGGYVVPVEALRLAIELYDRGATLTVDGHDLIVDAPGELLTHENRDRIQRWKQHLIAIAQYEPPTRQGDE